MGEYQTNIAARKRGEDEREFLFVGFAECIDASTRRVNGCFKIVGALAQLEPDLLRNQYRQAARATTFK
jgi:hypothetical protein